MSEARERNGPKPIKIIVAAGRNRGIGIKGNLPWNLPNEFKYFLDKITSVSNPGKKNFIMVGRTSFEGFPDCLLPLPNAIVAILSKTLRSTPKHAAYVCQDVQEVLDLASSTPLSKDIETIWALGGVQSYMEVMHHPWCNQIFFTNVMADFECDTFFPAIDTGVFNLVEQFPGVPLGLQEENGIKYEFQVYERKGSISM
ncbi:dihydrofolate reductase-like [Ambystoma mexicanum]|uniref:dihydrofolate reductase-like n=1 Tax=Ambystoma mexicanum TaxID=8296 RepID=UPI0037E7B161